MQRALDFPHYDVRSVPESVHWRSARKNFIIHSESELPDTDYDAIRDKDDE